MSRSVQLSLDGEQVCTPGSPRAKRGGTVVVISVMLFIGVGCGRARHRVRSWGVVTSQSWSRSGVSTGLKLSRFGFARGCCEPLPLSRVVASHARAQVCLFAPLCCVPAVGAERVWSRRVRVLRTGVVLVSRPPARGPFLRGARSGSRGRAPSPEYWLSCFRLTGHCLFSRSETNRVAVCSAEP